MTAIVSSLGSYKVEEIILGKSKVDNPVINSPLITAWVKKNPQNFSVYLIFFNTGC